MKVAVITTTFPKISETFVVHHITGLLDLGHDVNVFAFQKPQEAMISHGEILEYDLLKRTYYFRIPRTKVMRLLRLAFVLPAMLLKNPAAVIKSLNFKKYGRYEAISNVFKLEPFLKKRYDIIHFHFGTNARMFLFLKDIFPVKMVTSFHGYDISSAVREEGPRIYDELFQKMDLCLPVSEYFQKLLIDLGCPSAKIKVHPCGVNIEKFPFTERNFDFSKKIRIFTLGRLSPKKGLRYAILAVGQLTQKFPHLEYVMIGGGSQEQELKELVTRSGLQNTVKLLGALVQAEAMKYFYESDIFLLPSVTSEEGDQEGIPVSLKEAMATGIPVVSTYHAGIPELITDGQTGFLAPERDVDALAEKINHLIEHPEVCRKFSREGRRMIEENVDQKKINQRLDGIYKQLVFN